MREYEQLTVELSACLQRLYDGIECFLDGRSYNIDFEKYWAFGKI